MTCQRHKTPTKRGSGGGRRIAAPHSNRGRGRSSTSRRWNSASMPSRRSARASWYRSFSILVSRNPPTLLNPIAPIHRPRATYSGLPECVYATSSDQSQRSCQGKRIPQAEAWRVLLLFEIIRHGPAHLFIAALRGTSTLTCHRCYG